MDLGETMLIKEADDQSAHIRDLEQAAKGQNAKAKQAAIELRIRKAGIRGERDSAYLIDFHYAKSPNWAVIHDLRLEHDGRVAQIDHLMIDRWLDVYVLETKQFHAGIKITENGEFLRWNSYKSTYEGMASPLEQNERHIEVLREVMSQLELPSRLGIRITPRLQSFVLVASDARIMRPRKFDTSRVIKADLLKKAIWRDIEKESGLVGLLRTAAKVVSSETLEQVAHQLAARHRPLNGSVHPTTQPPVPPPTSGPVKSARQRKEPVFTATPISTAPSRQSPAGPECKKCAEQLGHILCGKFGYYFKCDACGTNTAIRFTCQEGHKPRLRKAGKHFYRECAECESSELFHQNRQEARK